MKKLKRTNSNDQPRKRCRRRAPKYSWDAVYRCPSGHVYSRWRTTPGIASENIFHLPDLIKKQKIKPLRVRLLCRKSDSDKDGNLDDQKTDAIDRLIDFGVHIVGCTTCVETSNIFGFRPDLMYAIECAKKENAVLCVLTRDRLLRCRNYDGTHKTEFPTVAEYKRLEMIAGGVPIATIFDPDAPPGEIRSKQTQRGKTAKGNPGGRPVKRRDAFREKWCPKVIELRTKNRSFRKIAKEITKMAGKSISHTAVRNWWLESFEM